MDRRKYKPRDAARHTRVTEAYVRAAWHNARIDAHPEKAARLKQRHIKYDRRKHGPHDTR